MKIYIIIKSKIKIKINFIRNIKLTFFIDNIIYIYYYIFFLIQNFIHNL